MADFQPGANYEVFPSDLTTLLQAMVRIRQPTMIWGPPGIGKSDIAEQTADVMNRKYLIIDVPTLPPEDLGVPYPVTSGGRKELRWAMPSFLPPEASNDRYLINIEELPSATPAIQAALWGLVLKGRFKDYRLPPGASIIACGNRKSDRGVFYRMSTPLANRFVHFTLRPSVDDWLEWAVANNIRLEIQFFVRWRRGEGGSFYNFNPNSEEYAFTSPRTLEFASNILHEVFPEDTLEPSIPPHLLRSTLVGTLGEATGIALAGWLTIWKEVPDPRAILDDPSGAPIPGKMDVLLATCGSLARLADGFTMDALVTYAKRLRREIGEFLVQQTVRNNNKLQKSHAWIEWATGKELN